MLRHAATSWHGVRLWQPDWRPTSHSFAFNAVLLREAVKLHLLMNAYWEPIDFELPAVANGTLWRRWIDTSLQSPEDIVPWNAALSVADRLYAPRRGRSSCCGRASPAVGWARPTTSLTVAARERHRRSKGTVTSRIVLRPWGSRAADSGRPRLAARQCLSMR